MRDMPESHPRTRVEMTLVTRTPADRRRDSPDTDTAIAIVPVGARTCLA